MRFEVLLTEDANRDLEKSVVGVTLAVRAWEPLSIPSGS